MNDTTCHHLITIARSYQVLVFYDSDILQITNFNSYVDSNTTKFYYLSPNGSILTVFEILEVMFAVFALFKSKNAF